MPLLRKKGLVSFTLFAVLYGLSVCHLNANSILSAKEAFRILGIYGIGLGGVAYLVTLRSKKLAAEIRSVRGEAMLTLLLIALITAWLCGGSGLIGRLAPEFLGARGHALRILAQKLILFVLLPYFLFRLTYQEKPSSFGLSKAGLARLWGPHGVAALIVGSLFACTNLFLEGGGAPIRAGEIAKVPLIMGLFLGFIWNLIETGLVEEFFFRAIVQARISAGLRSEVAGAIVAILIFGLAHAPGFVLRGAGSLESLSSAPTWSDAMAYSVVTLSIAALPFAVLWARTRNLWLLIIVHALMDAVPNLPDFIKTWF